VKAVDAPPRPPNGAFAVLRHFAFRWIWLGSFASNVGNWMETVAQAWLVQQQSHSPFLVDLLAAAEFIPVALLALPAGALADRQDRRKLLVIGQSAMMIMAAVLAVLTHLHYATPAVIIALAFLEGAAWASVMPAWQALVPALVPREELPPAIRLGARDEDQAAHALAEGRVLFTQDRDFLRIHARGAPHAGIAYSEKGALPVGEIISRLVLLWDVYEPEEMANRVEYL